MIEGQSDDEFNRARAELFEALGHPTRIKILNAMKDNAISFSELKKATGIESSGHLTFHLEKLDGLVKAGSDGRYLLTDEGKEAIRLVGRKALTYGGLPAGFFLKWLLIAAAATGLIAVVVGVGMNAAGIAHPSFLVSLMPTYAEVAAPLAVFLWKTNQWRKAHQASVPLDL